LIDDPGRSWSPAGDSSFLSTADPPLVRSRTLGKMSLRPALFATTLTLLACDTAPPTPATPAPARPSGLKALALQAPDGSTKVDDRLRELQTLVGRQPDKFDAWILLGRGWVQKARQAADPGYYANANAAAGIALELKPDHPLGLDLRALVLMNDHRFADAKDLAERSLAKDPDDLMALGNLSDALLELGDFDAAGAAAQKMVDLKPNLPSYARVAYLRFLRGDNLGAKQAYRMAMDAGQSTKDTEPLAWVTVDAAKVFLSEGDLEGAEAGYERALAVSPGYPAALAGLARVRLAQLRAGEAAALAKKSFELSALAETAWLWGDAARAAGLSEEADAAFARLIRLGEHGEGRVLSAFYASEGRDHQAALGYAEKELKTRGEIHSWDAKAWALHRLGRDVEALEAMERATRLGTKEPLLSFHEGAIRIALGDRKLGCKAIESAIAGKLHFPLKAAGEAATLSAECLRMGSASGSASRL
jgi:tetratricopeptide (TPR) repeat protein